MTTELHAEAVKRLKSRRIRVGDDLRDPVMVAEVDEQQMAVVALAVDPARQADGLADVAERASSAQLWVR